jgi:hypothetical protein
MKPKIITALFITAAVSHGSTIITAAPSAAGIPYRHTISMNAEDNATVTRHVGAWSWEDNSLFDAGNGEPPVGWTHTSDWVALALLQPARLTLRLERQEGVSAPTAQNPENIAAITSMFPSFSIYAGWDQDGEQDHTFNNRGAIAWASVFYLDHLDNSTLPSAERTWELPAGNYSIILGSNAPATDPNRQGYRATFTSVVPEPGLSALTALAGGVMLLRRRR